MASPERIPVACLGAGRMGRGIAVQFAYAGHEVVLLDAKPRPAEAFEALQNEALAEIGAALRTLGELGLFDPVLAEALLARVRVVPDSGAAEALGSAGIVFEGVPEVLDLKREALARASALMAPDAILASTTSTILVDDLSPAVAGPERFLNAHWLNPAYIIPLVEVSSGRATAPETVARLNALLESVGKVPVTCAASPGFIVPRIQALAMNEAARMVEEGVASAEDIDKAVKYGFGFRFGVLGVLEFIDWGGGDILYHASRYLTGALGHERYRAPEIIERNMQEGRIGLRTGQGFLNYDGQDIESYRRRRLGALVDRLRAEGLAKPPVLPD
ncbi:3-hydroxybutyryl-CoA dehydrogenase [Roseomonas sp. SSH11]|uniref:L-gulonate 3-dehydrogenase n=1 Tax=Pararoseomonas baculiformis TaxID=2820812 RepID=A0ABS4ABU1_9PROT|nr:3-hydroxybutyryl-CoA dehydrogenase [Pararoseomonas baculiformis]MBP0444479.1 3-hydroxybutyryl-CoA dehydrogenase [Pararoseomonas baculiformis]